MNIKYVLVIVVFVCGYIIAVRQSNIKIATMTQSYKKQIDTINQKYEVDIKNYQDQIQSIQQNNIVKTVTVYKPGGVITITKLVDRSEKKVNKEVASTVVADKVDVTNSSIIADSMVSNKFESKSSTESNYMFGISNWQPQNDINLTDVDITAGIRLGSLPLMATLAFTPSFTFYKNISFGVVIFL